MKKTTIGLLILLISQALLILARIYLSPVIAVITMVLLCIVSVFALVMIEDKAPNSIPSLLVLAIIIGDFAIGALVKSNYSTVIVVKSEKVHHKEYHKDTYSRNKMDGTTFVVNLEKGKKYIDNQTQYELEEYSVEYSKYSHSHRRDVYPIACDTIEEVPDTPDYYFCGAPPSIKSRSSSETKWVLKKVERQYDY